MKILVTGGCGFIGSNFIEYILGNYKNDVVVCVDKITYAGSIDNIRPFSNNKNFKFIKEDICNSLAMEKIFKENSFDYVVNFAAESSVDFSIAHPDITYNTNVGGLICLIDLAKKYHVKRFHQVSTDEVYGPNLGQPFLENTPLQPTNPYSNSKAIGDVKLINEFKQNSFPMTITRSSNNFGPNQYIDKLIPLVIYNALNNKSIPIYGDGNYYRDWIFVDDHCKAIDLVLRFGTLGNIYNVSTNNIKSNLEIVRYILNKLSKPESLMVNIADRKNHDRRYAINADKIVNELGFNSKNNFYTSLDYTIDYYIKKFKNIL